jgi:hypothetical protein
MDEILENNLLLSEFIGSKQTDNGYFIPIFGIVNINSVELGQSKTTKYHKDWNWLMTVVDHIETLSDDLNGNYCVYIHSNCCQIFGSKFKQKLKQFNFEQYDLDKQTATYKCVITFINWYNKNKHATI